MNRQQKIVVM